MKAEEQLDLWVDGKSVHNDERDESEMLCEFLARMLEHEGMKVT